MEIKMPTVFRANGYTTIDAKVGDTSGIHVRPTRLICTETSRYAPRKITIQKKGFDQKYDCSQAMQILSADIRYPNDVTISVEGEDELAENACQNIAYIISRSLYEIEQIFKEYSQKK
jgi:phosphotransferase system HPr (HPr) family protein